MGNYRISVILVTLSLVVGPVMWVGFPIHDVRAQQGQRSGGNFQPARIEDRTVSVAGVPFDVEQGLLTLRNGTLTLSVKRGTVAAGSASALVTDARLVLGENVTAAQAQRIRRNIAHGTLTTANGVSTARVAATLLTVAADGTAVSRTNVSETVGRPTTTSGAAVAGPNEAGFTVMTLDAPRRVSSGESFTVRARVTNPGTHVGTEDVEYRFGGVIVQRRILTLEPGASKTVSFQASPGLIPTAAGTYDHGVYAFDSNRTAHITLGGNQSQSGSHN